jgi:SAM-dependent methyltransferase
MSALYGEDLAAIHAAGFTGIAERAARELLARLSAPARVVELGCGDGTAARILADAGHDVYGFDVSPHFVRLARQRVPEARFDIASVRDVTLPRCEAVLAAGEVLGYLLDDEDDPLDAVLEPCTSALSPGGILLFDLAGPGRPTGSSRTAGAGWLVLSQTTTTTTRLTRRIVTYRSVDGAWRRGEETHRLRLHEPRDVLDRLEAADFSARVLEPGYDGAPLPAGITAFEARAPGSTRAGAGPARSPAGSRGPSREPPSA